MVGVNVGKNKTTEKAEEDYVQGARVRPTHPPTQHNTTHPPTHTHTHPLQELGSYADYLVINVSSPNPPIHPPTHPPTHSPLSP